MPRPTGGDTSATRPGRPPDPEREAASLDAALEVLAEVGYDRLTVSAVHRRARASAKTVYRRWSGKEELMTAALQRAISRSARDPADVTDTVANKQLATLAGKFLFMRQSIAAIKTMQKDSAAVGGT